MSSPEKSLADLKALAAEARKEETPQAIDQIPNAMPENSNMYVQLRDKVEGKERSDKLGQRSDGRLVDLTQRTTQAHTETVLESTLKPL